MYIFINQSYFDYNCNFNHICYSVYEHSTETFSEIDEYADYINILSEVDNFSYKNNSSINVYYCDILSQSLSHYRKYLQIIYRNPLIVNKFKPITSPTIYRINNFIKQHKESWNKFLNNITEEKKVFNDNDIYDYIKYFPYNKKEYLYIYFSFNNNQKLFLSQCKNSFENWNYENEKELKMNKDNKILEEDDISDFSD